MPTPQELESEFWKSLKSDMTMMLGIAIQGGHARPMTVLVEEERSPFWFFSSKESELVQLLNPSRNASATFTAKVHDLFATLHGKLAVDTDRNVIDRLWNPYIAAWYEQGKDDPKLVLLRLDVDHAHIWENATTLFAGIKLLLGADPKSRFHR